MNLSQALRLPESRATAPTERRDPTAATRPTHYQAVGQPMVREWDGESAIRWAYLANVYVFACVRLIANKIAALPFRAGADPTKPMDYNTNARLAQLLGPPPGGPNPNLSGQKLIANAIAQKYVTGYFGWELELGPRTKEILALWPLASSALRAVPSQGGVSYFTEFLYGPVGDPKRLTPERCFYDWEPSLTDFRQPMSLLQAARLDISVAVMQDRYDVAFLKNDARPASVVVTDAFADPESKDAFQDQWRDEYGGPQNAGKTAFLESHGDEGPVGAIEIKTLGLSQKDAEFIKRYEQKIKGICIALGVPMSLLDASGRTFDNAEAEERNFYENTIKPIISDFEDAINLRLAPRLGPDVGWFDLSGVEALQPKPKFQFVGLDALVAAKILTRNEAREKIGEEAIDDGDEFVEPPEVVPTPQPPELVDKLPEAASAPKGGRRDDNVVPIDQEVRRTRIWRTADRQVKALETQWEKAWRGHFAKQEGSVIARLEGKRGRQALERRETPDPNGVFDPSFWERETAAFADGLFDGVATVGAVRVADAFDVAFDIEAPYVRDFIQNRSNKLAGHVTNTTYNALKDQLTEGVANGETIPQLAARVRSIFEEASTNRAVTIARTEVISAYNGSSSLIASELGPDIVAGQEWISTPGKRTRDAHAGANGQVVPVGSPFVVGGESMSYPGDPGGSASNTVNCRCTVALLTPDEFKASYSRKSAESRFAKAAEIRERLLGMAVSA